MWSKLFQLEAIKEQLRTILEVSYASHNGNDLLGNHFLNCESCDSVSLLDLGNRVILDLDCGQLGNRIHSRS